MGSKQFVCICCPRGCLLSVDDSLKVSGNKCLRGEKYGREEMIHPLRTLTSSVRVTNRDNLLVSVKTSSPIPKEKIFIVMEEINKIRVDAPLEVGQILVEDICSCGASLVVTKKIR